MQNTRTIVGGGLILGAVVFVALLAGVGSGALTNESTAAERAVYSSGSTSTTVPDEATPGGAVLAVTRIDFANGTVTITNHGDVAADLAGHQLCNFPSYAPISGTIDPGASMEFSFGPLDPASGELGLYSSSDFGSSDAIVAYVEWGDANHQRSPVAVGAGVWDGSLVTVGGDAIEASVDQPTTAADWSSP